MLNENKIKNTRQNCLNNDKRCETQAHAQNKYPINLPEIFDAFLMKWFGFFSGFMRKFCFDEMHSFKLKRNSEKLFHGKCRLHYKDFFVFFFQMLSMQNRYNFCISVNQNALSHSWLAMFITIFRHSHFPILENFFFFLFEKCFSLIVFH